MNKYTKEFLHRGLMFGGFGPIVLGIIFCILSCTLDDFTLTGFDVLMGVLSTYLLAFIQAGASVFNQIEHWPLPKALLCHFGVLYLAYSICYIANRWIPFDPWVLVVFTAIFTVGYFLVWSIVCLCVRAVSRKLNKKI